MFSVKVIDPEGDQFNIFDSRMYYDPEYGRSFEIPFGASIEADHIITFTSSSSYTYNMLIRITQGPKCLHDKMEQEDIDTIVFYEVKKFDNGMTGETVEKTVNLDTDITYNCYIARVSAISVLLSSDVRVDYDIEDPDGNIFEIYSYELIATIDGINKFSFGTAMEGDYKIRITVYSVVPNVNVGYAISDVNQLTDIEDVNNTDGDTDSDRFFLFDFGDDDGDGSFLDNPSELPFIWVIGTIIVIGGVVSATVITISKQQKKNVYDTRRSEK